MPPSNGIVRLFSITGSGPFGGGLAWKGQIITAAHVVNTALGRGDITFRERPSREEAVLVDFPLESAQSTYNAKVWRWQSPSDGDIATLHLDASTPPGGEQARLGLDSDIKSGTKVLVMGFPKNNPSGIIASAHITGSIPPPDCYQLDDDRLTGAEVEEGFSGCPVWLEEAPNVAVGIILRANRRRISAMYHIKAAARFRFDEPRVGTPNWKVDFLRREGITALLNDLTAVESEGLDRKHCDAVRLALEGIENEFSAVDGEAIAWQTPLYEDISRLSIIYMKWNGHGTGPGEAEKRRKDLKRLRGERNKLSRKMGEARAALFQEPLDSLADASIGHLDNLAKCDNRKFRNTSMMARKYRRKEAEAG